MSYDDIMCDIKENCHDLWKDGYDHGWMACASEKGKSDPDACWCDGFLTAWNASASTKLYTRNAGDPWHFECARCGATAMQGVQLGANVVKFKYCPNCGAEVTHE